jgi:hypothetical protein
LVTVVVDAGVAGVVVVVCCVVVVRTVGSAAQPLSMAAHRNRDVARTVADIIGLVMNGCPSEGCREWVEAAVERWRRRLMA